MDSKRRNLKHDRPLVNCLHALLPFLRLVFFMPNILDCDTGTLLFKARGHNSSLHLLEIDMCNLSLLTIEDLGNLLESWATGFDVKEGDKDEFKENPDL